MSLNVKQKRFAEEYLIDSNATQAAIRAGYSEKTAESQASKLLINPKVASEIARLEKKRARRTEIDQDYVLQALVSTIERCRQVEPVLSKGKPVFIDGPDGKKAAAYRFNAAGVFKGLELLGKHLGMFSDKLKVEHSFETFSDEELLYEFRQASQAAGVNPAQLAMLEDLDGQEPRQ